MRKLRILHISADFPDNLVPAKTPVIRTLLELVADRFEQSVLSLNRVSPRPGAFAMDCLGSFMRPQLRMTLQGFEYGEAIAYAAPGRGLFHISMLRQLGEQLAERLAASGELPDLLIGHKLTVEGIAVQVAARRLGLPYALSIQGNTDAKILASRPDAKAIFARCFHDAAVVFPFAPWALEAVEARLGKRHGPVIMLPCATEIDTPLAPDPQGEGLVSLFHLRGQHTKNLSGMGDALRLLEARGALIPLAILGGGTDEELAQCRKIARGAPGLSFEGPLDRAALPARLNRAAGFVLPSRRESFGLVFIEALFCGLPIIYPAGAGVDGYFDGAPFALRVDARDSQSIADAMQRLVTEQASLKAALAEWQQSPAAARFTRAAIGSAFAKGVEQAAGSLAQDRPSSHGDEAA